MTHTKMSKNIIIGGGVIVVLAGIMLLASHSPERVKALTMDEIISGGQVRSASSRTKQIQLSKLSLKSGAEVDISALSPIGGTVISSQPAISGAAGVLTVYINSSSPIPDNVIFRIKPKGYLSRLQPNINLADPAIQTITLDFVAGDANGDNVIDESDKAAVKNAWGTTDTAADTNGDGLVNSFDMLPVLINMGQHGE